MAVEELAVEELDHSRCVSQAARGVYHCESQSAQAQGASRTKGGSLVANSHLQVVSDSLLQFLVLVATVASNLPVFSNSGPANMSSQSCSRVAARAGGEPWKSARS